MSRSPSTLIPLLVVGLATGWKEGCPHSHKAMKWWWVAPCLCITTIASGPWSTSSSSSPYHKGPRDCTTIERVNRRSACDGHPTTSITTTMWGIRGGGSAGAPTTNSSTSSSSPPRGKASHPPNAPPGMTCEDGVCYIK